MSTQLRTNQNSPRADVLKAMPKGWSIKPLGEVVTRIIGGGTPSRDNPSFWDGDIPWLTVKDMRTTRPADAIDHISRSAVGESSTNIIPADTVIIATRIGLGKVIRVPYEAAINQDLKALIVPENIEKAFLEYWFLSIASYLESIGSGTTVKGIRLEQLRDLKFPLPPLPEQRRIVAEIEKQFTRLDAGVAALKRVQANLKRYRAAVLKAACEGRLVPTEAELVGRDRRSRRPYETGEALLARILEERRKNWTGRGKYKEPAAASAMKLPELPAGWVWATVEQLAAPEPNSITDGPFGSNLKTEHYMDSGPRVIRLQNIGDGVYVDEEAHISKTHFERLQKHRVFANDVVIAGFGENPPRSCIIPETLGPAIVKADCIRFKPHRSIMSKYMNVALNSDPVRKRTKGMVHGVGRPRLNLGEIKSIVLPLPPLAEQTRIVAEVERRLSVVEELEAVVTANLQRAGRLRRSILQKAFTEKL